MAINVIVDNAPSHVHCIHETTRDSRVNRIAVHGSVLRGYEYPWVSFNGLAIGMHHDHGRLPSEKQAIE